MTSVFTTAPVGFTSEGEALMRETLQGDADARLRLAQETSTLLTMTNSQFSKVRNVLGDWRNVQKFYELAMVVAKDNLNSGGDMLQLLLEQCLEAYRQSATSKTEEAIKQFFIT